MVDEHYIARWKEPLGHVVLFEALPGTTEAVRALMDEACGWLRGRGLEAARSGWSGSAVDWPYTVDAYELLPPPAVRQNPPYYHSLLKEARFVAEKGMVDYKIRVTPELVQRWERMLQAAEGSGFRVLSFAEAEPGHRARTSRRYGRPAFAHHWGTSPGSLAEWQQVFDRTGPIGAQETSTLAYRGDEPVGATICLPDISGHTTVVGDRQLSDEERLNLFGIGVVESARGTGLNLAVAARSYLELAKRGQTHISYTLVVDDNWPSRRTAEKLGAWVCGNYLVYRRDLTRP